MTFHPRAILHYVSSCVILCHAVISQVHEAAGGRWEWAQLHPGGRGKLSGRDLLPGGNELGVSILLEQSTGAEGNLLFLGAQWADKRKGTSQITLLMAISIGCACTGDLTKKKRDIRSCSRQLSSFHFSRLKEKLGHFIWLRMRSL